MDLRAALQYIVDLSAPKTFEIEETTYSSEKLYPVEEPYYYPERLTVHSLDAIVKLVKAELADYTDGQNKAPLPLFIRVDGPTSVSVFSRMNDRCKRDWLYLAQCDDTEFREGFREQQKAIIELRSRFLPTDDTIYLVDLISRINNEEGVKSEDNGVSQTVTARKGVSLMQTEYVKPRLSLQPFRTFREVPQPESEFILRLDDNGNVGLFEADGGIWKMEAQDNLRQYLEGELDAQINANMVVVMV
ncbi:MAG: hypothetical protein IJ649_03830 [Oscillospiraceae bacterium]|nr:hypothetical protein [Oscillospiraceae bacterium]